jgi:hypothetical protein
MGAVMRPTAFLVIPFTAEANQWLDANIDNRLMHEGIPFDHSDIEAILAGLEEAGLAEGVDYEVV